MPGQLDPRHWYANYAESGGRVLGEACHFLDYFCFLFDAQPVRVLAQTTWPAGGRLPFPDSVTAQIEFADGSCGQLVYSAEGDRGFPKEVLTVYAAGVVAEITNFQELVVHRGRKRKSISFSSKGHAEEMAAWAQFLRGQAGHPLPYEKSRAGMRLTFAVLESIREAASVEVEGHQVCRGEKGGEAILKHHRDGEQRQTCLSRVPQNHRNVTAEDLLWYAIVA